MNAESRTQSGDIVTLEHIFFSYRTNSGGTRSVLRDVNLSLKPHHRIGLYGPNGSGKTTLHYGTEPAVRRAGSLPRPRDEERKGLP